MLQYTTYRLSRSIPAGAYLKVVLPVLFVLLLINTLIDFWQSVANEHAFYWSESILFGSYWWLYVPIVYVQVYWLKKMGTPSLFRIVAMFLIPISIHAVIYPTVVYLFSWLFFSHTYAFDRVLGYGIASYLLQTMIVYAVPLIWHWWRNKQEQVLANSPAIVNDITHSPLAAAPDFMMVQDGQKHSKILIEQVLYFSANHPYINIHLTHKKYLHKETLRSIAERFHSSGFIRVHRSAVVNIAAVVSYRSRTNGDYDLELIDGSWLRMSRSYADFFLHAYRIMHPLTAK